MTAGCRIDYVYGHVNLYINFECNRLQTVSGFIFPQNGWILTIHNKPEKILEADFKKTINS